MLRRHIKSVITINSEKTLVTYKNQPKSCIHCLQPLHSGKSCTENRKAAKNTAQANGNNDRNSTIAEAISPSAPVMQNSMNQDGTSQQKANEKSKQQYKRNVRQLSPGETKPPPAKRADMKTTVETTTAHGRARDEEENEMDTASSVDLSEPEPAQDDLDKWISFLASGREKWKNKQKKF